MIIKKIEIKNISSGTLFPATIKPNKVIVKINVNNELFKNLFRVLKKKSTKKKENKENLCIKDPAKYS